ncbi:hypothetical protein [Acinetobacter baumannii]|nr:hypothetical protein [Acinetobacter baumannii]
MFSDLLSEYLDEQAHYVGCTVRLERFVIASTILFRGGETK